MHRHVNFVVAAILILSCVLVICAASRRRRRPVNRTTIQATQTHTSNNCMDKHREFISTSNPRNGGEDGDQTVTLYYVPGVLGSLYIDMFINGVPTVFFVDTGYAGPPVINPWHQAREESVIENIGEKKWTNMTTRQRIEKCDETQGLLQLTDEGLSRFVNRHTCSTYASTCTMRLAGIASDTERVTDMVLCPELVPGSTSDKSRGNHPEADLLVSMTMKGVTHVLTLDYLQSHVKFRIDRFNGGSRTARLSLGSGLTVPPNWKQLKTKFIHGVFAVSLNVKADGTSFKQGWFTMDTGSSAPLVVNKSFVEENSLPSSLRDRFVQQRGVNSETTCAKVLRSVTIQALTADGASISAAAPVLLNDTNTMGVQGYAGLELIAAWGGIFVEDRAVYVPPTVVEAAKITNDFFGQVDTDSCGPR